MTVSLTFLCDCFKSHSTWPFCVTFYFHVWEWKGIWEHMRERGEWMGIWRWGRREREGKGRSLRRGRSGREWEEMGDQVWRRETEGGRWERKKVSILLYDIIWQPAWPLYLTTNLTYSHDNRPDIIEWHSVWYSTCPFCITVWPFCYTFCSVSLPLSVTFLHDSRLSLFVWHPTMQ